MCPNSKSLDRDLGLKQPWWGDHLRTPPQVIRSRIVQQKHKRQKTGIPLSYSKHGNTKHGSILETASWLLVFALSSRVWLLVFGPKQRVMKISQINQTFWNQVARKLWPPHIIHTWVHSNSRLSIVLEKCVHVFRLNCLVFSHPLTSSQHIPNMDKYGWTCKTCFKPRTSSSLVNIPKKYPQKYPLKRQPETYPHGIFILSIQTSHRWPPLLYESLQCLAPHRCSAAWAERETWQIESNLPQSLNPKSKDEKGTKYKASWKICWLKVGSS